MLATGIKLVLVFVAIAGSSLVEEDPNIPKVFDTNVINYPTIYTQEFIQKMASQSGPSRPPTLNSFNDPFVKQQLRKNVILIIDKMLSMPQSNMSGCELQRLSEAKSLRDIYTNDELFNSRPLPRYYHVTDQKAVPLILDSMVIKFANATFPGAWFATGFYQINSPTGYTPMFAFGSELEVPVSEASILSHYIGIRSYKIFGLGRLHDVPIWNGNTNLVNWGVPMQYLENTTNYINTQFDPEKASFLLSRLVPIDQIILERQLLTIAHAHTNDRANAIFSMVVSYNETTNEFTCLNLRIVNRETTLVTGLRYSSHTFLKKYVPDVSLQDMTQLMQLIADGKLLDQPPPTTVNLKRSVAKMMARATRVTAAEVHGQERFVEKQ